MGKRSNPMRRILAAVRMLRSLRRRVFGSVTPHWANDIPGFFKALNFFSLIPTLAAIFFVPQHFFKRVDLIITKRRSGVGSVYRSPVGLTSRVFVLVLATVQFAPIQLFTAQMLRAIPNGSAQTTHPQLFLALAILFTPIIVPVISGVLLVISIVGIVMVGGFGTSSSFQLTANLCRLLLVPMDIRTYRNQDWRRVGWCALYFAAYLITLPLGLFLLLVFSLRLLLNTFPVLASESYSSGVVKVWGVIALLSAIILGRVLAYPYTALLMICRKSPTDLMLKIYISRLTYSIARFLESAKIAQKSRIRLVKLGHLRQADKARKNANEALKGLDRHWRSEQIRRGASNAQIEAEQKRVLTFLPWKVVKRKGAGVSMEDSSEKDGLFELWNVWKSSKSDNDLDDKSTKEGQSASQASQQSSGN